jgi:hypothetical protein
MFRPPIGSATRSNRCCALPHRDASQRAPTCSCLRPAPVSASPFPGPADGAMGQARSLLPRLPSYGGYQLHRTEDGPTGSCGGSPLYAWGLPFPTDAWARAGFAPRRWKRPHRGLPALSGPLLGHGGAVGVCGPASLWTSVAGTARAARARSRLAGLVALACSVVATRPHAPRRSLRSGVVRVVFYCRVVCCDPCRPVLPRRQPAFLLETGWRDVVLYAPGP